jgi:hypothetical protein
VSGGEPTKRVYVASHEARRLLKIRGLIISLTFSLGLGAAAIAILLFAVREGAIEPDLAIAIAIGMFVVVAAMAGVSWLLVLYNYRRFTQTRLEISGSTITRRRGSITDEIAISGLSRVEVQTLPSGRTYLIKLKRGLFRDQTVTGFEDMESVAADLEAVLGNVVPFQRRRLRLDWSNSAVWSLMWAVMVGGVVASVAALQWLASADVLEAATGLLALALGLYSLLTRPTSRQGVLSPRQDIVAGCFWLVAGSWWLLRSLQ